MPTHILCCVFFLSIKIFWMFHTLLSDILPGRLIGMVQNIWITALKIEIIRFFLNTKSSWLVQHASHHTRKYDKKITTQKNWEATLFEFITLYCKNGGSFFERMWFYMVLLTNHFFCHYHFWTKQRWFPFLDETTTVW